MLTNQQLDTLLEHCPIEEVKRWKKLRPPPFAQRQRRCITARAASGIRQPPWGPAAVIEPQKPRVPHASVCERRESAGGVAGCWGMGLRLKLASAGLPKDRHPV